MILLIVERIEQKVRKLLVIEGDTERCVSECFKLLSELYPAAQWLSSRRGGHCERSRVYSKCLGHVGSLLMAIPMNCESEPVGKLRESYARHQMLLSQMNRVG